MKKWEIFEEKSVTYLNDKFGKYAIFIPEGGSDSTKPDILVKTHSKKQFYIDAKLFPAQSGQFVLFPNFHTKTFEYSEKNTSRINLFTNKIIECMNNNFTEFSQVGTSGKDINFIGNSLVFSNWIVQTYKEKGTRLIITNNNILFPIEKLSEYFDVSAKYRTKRSGSGNVGKTNINSIIEYLKTQKFYTTNYETKESKLFVQSNLNLDKIRFFHNNNEYMFAQRDLGYEIRKLSNTKNSNVIFSVKLKNDISGLTDREFINLLR